MELFSLSPRKKESISLLKERDELPFSQLSKDQIWSGVKLIFNATFSSSLSLLCVFIVNLISLAYISNLKDAAMIGGIGLGFVCSNCCAYILITSIDQGVNALAAQAHGGNRPDLVALNYHRGLLIQLIIIIPIFLALGFTKEFLVFFGIDPVVAQHAWDYIKFAYPSFVFYGIFDATKSYLFAQKIFSPILKIQFGTMILHIFWSWLFIEKLGMGPAGAGIAKNIFELFNLVLLILYIKKTNCCQASWVPLAQIDWKNTVAETEGIKKFVSFTIPIAAILFLDMACYEVFSILAGQFDENQLAVHVAVANSATLFYSLPLGLSIAIMTYVSHAMGAGQINKAKNYTYCGIVVDIIFTIVFLIFTWIFRSNWAELFSANEETKHLLLGVLNIYLAMIFFDGIQVSLSGTLKGIGKQNAATVGMIVSYYFVALPLIYLLAFELDMQVKGIWLGFLTGIVALLIIYLIILKKTNFRAQAKTLSKHLDNEIELAEKI